MALDAIGLIGGKDRLQEISMRLDDSHLAYLQLDESPLKLQARHKLEGFIKEYLCHVPNERKYIFQETADILHRSAATVKNFSGYRACTAWSAVSLYAANLLAQPWRKEYRTLRTYSGYYKHEIEANLIGAELMFELMGYKHTGLGVLTLEGPIDPDKVSSVSRDAIVAFVECQILKEIWESVSKNFTISWLEVLEFRWNSVGTAEQAIRALNFRFRERMQQMREKNSTYRDYRHVQPMGIDPSLSAMTPALTPYHVMANNYNSTILPTMCKPDSVYPSDGNFYFTPIDTGTMTNRFVNQYACGPPMHRYFPVVHAPQGNPSISSAVPGHATRVPTGRLIELDTPLPVVNYERNTSHPHNEVTVKSSKSRIHDTEMDEVDFRRCQSEDADRADYARVEKKSASKLSHNNDEGKINDWEFVYKGLESLGYSKDLGERDDVLRRREQMMEARNSSRTQHKNSRSLANLEPEKFGSRIVRDEKRKIESGGSGKVSNFNEDGLTSVNGQETRGLAFGNKGSLEWQDSSATPSDSLADKANKKYSNTLPSTKPLYKSGSEPQATVKNFDSSRDNKPSGTRESTGRWDCATCTFLNPPGREICEMCGKSRRKGNEDKPLVRGGKECPHCTLVNEKNAAACEACGSSLKDSPTYI